MEDLYKFCGTLCEAWQGATGPRPTDQVWQEAIIVILIIVIVMIIILIIANTFMASTRENNHHVHQHHLFHGCHCPQIIL